MLKNILFFLLIFTLTEAFAMEAIPLTDDESKVLIKIIADQNHNSTHKQNAFQTLLNHSAKKEPHYITYCDPKTINLVKEVPASLYEQIVKSMTISCVDTFVYNFESKTYFMVLRSTPPAKDQWWLPGGRIFKGESFFESAIRKTKQESGLDICPIAQLGTYSTYFTDSAWGADVPTDTKNTIVLALCNDQIPLLNEYHEKFKWVSINEAPSDPYLLDAYKEAKMKLSEFGFIF